MEHGILTPFDLLSRTVPGLLAHVPQTLLYWVMPSVLSLALGTLICMVRVGRTSNPLYWLTTVFVSFFRGTPAIIQMFLVFFGLPKLFWALGYDIQDWSAGTFFVIATTLNLSCFMAEALRGGYLSLGRGQIEAGLSIGYGRVRNFVHVIAPQTLKLAMLNLKNLEIAVLKDTSVAYTIGAVEIMGYADRMVSLNSGVGQLWVLAAAALIYFALCTVLEVGFNAVSRHMSRHDPSQGVGA